MSGRSLFNKIKYLVYFILFLLRFLPSFIKELLYEIMMFFPTKVGVLFRSILVMSLSDCGDNLYIGTNVKIKNFKGLKIGSNVSIHENCFIDAIGGVEIGDNVSIAHNSSLISFNHTYSNKELPIKYNTLFFDKIILKSDVWVGCGSRILAGSYLNERTIVAAGAIVTSHFEGNSIIAGVPAKVIKGI
ncbi:TPA: acyltransferase [Vibrio parahaemolyticus]|uniref:Putative acetyltransferase n=1 Tax=Vibrio parahaemolyticus TaxID=670 RepID=A0A7M1WRT4_VIBPH|nr:acyltransferase [Vibrio parahaemolyticus]MDF4633546.1 acyltransferase [Vibrio parahaemolyticus]MDG2620046.1 acyltransferase [Vibrio parahaemolyticus]MDG3435020.1 acyltransferase [Vibrio parahaemolyticus]QOS29773.1 putative acetyltransferase [Vibrio parahaemolyticus]HCH0796584.1 acyltransferase [Vibrio parahaemolyticus]